MRIPDAFIEEMAEKYLKIKIGKQIFIDFLEYQWKHYILNKGK